MGNKDPILTLLKDFSYTAVRLPRAGINPLLVLQQDDHELTVLGDLPGLFIIGSDPLPRIRRNKPAAFINGKSTRQLSLGVGISLLGNIIGAMTGNRLKLETEYKRAGSVTYEFENVTLDDVDQIELSRYLASSQMARGLDAIADALENNRLYVITSTLQSRSFTTVAQNEAGVAVPLNVPMIRGAVGGRVTVKAAGNKDSRVTYEGQEPLVFGIQAAQIEFRDGRVRGLSQTGKPELVVRGIRKGEKQAQFRMLETDAPFLKLSTVEGTGAERSVSKGMNRGIAMQKGSTGSEVKRWQSFLISRGYMGGQPDGVFGAGTFKATMAFQQAHGLTPNGIAGPETLREAPEFSGDATAAVSVTSGVLADLTESMLKQVMPGIAAANCSGYLPFLKQAMSEFEINTPARAAAFLSQLAHESGQFKFMMEIWGPTPAQNRYEPPSDLARQLGNQVAGDGKRFKGRGPIQLTGRANYKTYGDLLGVDLIGNPDKAAEKDVAFRTAGLYWKKNRLSELADKQWFMTITKRINGGFNGLEDRVKYYERALTVLGVPRMRARNDDPGDDSGIPRFSRGLDGSGNITPTAIERSAKEPAKKPTKKPAKKLAKKPTKKAPKKPAKKPVKKARAEKP
jgi:putative chitinase